MSRPGTPLTISPSMISSAGICWPAPGLGTAAASWCSRISCRTLLTLTASASAAAFQSSQSAIRVARSSSGVFSLTRPCCHHAQTRAFTSRVKRLGAPKLAGQSGLFPSPTQEEIVERTADAMIGRVLDGRYRVGPKIARGGMATVYEATDLRLDRTVAVKVMHEGLADDDEFVRRFQREARSAARLAHHNVVAVFDTGDDHGTLFLVMEYVPGLTMRDLIRKEAPMSPAKALAVIEPVLGALAAAHDAGILHRDVKPENVLMADDGRVKVADFGLARAINSETQHTATGGVLIGTVSYLSPELVVNGKADARADVYAAGVLLYEMLTGHKPHQADSPIQVAYKHVHEDIPAPSACDPGIPAYVDALVARATARDTAMRPADARVLLHQVRRVRNALDHGVVDDPELMDDLTPTIPVGGARTPTGELPAQIIEPQEPEQPAERRPDRTTTGSIPAGSTDVTTSARDAPPRRPPPAPLGPADRGAPASARAGGRCGSRSSWCSPCSPPWAAGTSASPATPPPRACSTSARPPPASSSTRPGCQLKVAETGLLRDGRQGASCLHRPGPGDRVRKDGTVGAVISLGPERHAVPDVRGKTLDDAQQVLDARSWRTAGPGRALRRVGAPRQRDPHRPGAGDRPAPRHGRRRGRQQRAASRSRSPTSPASRPPPRPSGWRSSASRSTPARSTATPCARAAWSARARRRGHRPEGRPGLAGGLQGPGAGDGAQRRPDGGTPPPRDTLEAAGFTGRGAQGRPLHRGAVRRRPGPPARHAGAARAARSRSASSDARRSRARHTRHIAPLPSLVSHTGNVVGSPRCEVRRAPPVGSGTAALAPTEERMPLPRTLATLALLRPRSRSAPR